MSYILDALKKSDQERKQGDVPNLQTIHIPISTEPKAPVGLYGVIALLLLLLAFVIGLVMANREPEGMVENERPAVQQAEEVHKEVVVPEVVGAKIAEKPVSPVREKMQPVQLTKQHSQVQKKAPDRLVQKNKRPAQPVYDTVLPAKSRAESPVTEVANAGAQAKMPDVNDVPYLHELADYLQQSVPQMTFAGHVYSSDPANRSVIINDAFMSEGDTMLQGIDIIQITPTGVVFSLNDAYFRVDILQDWSLE